MKSLDRNDKILFFALAAALTALVIVEATLGLANFDKNALIIGIISTFIAAFAGTWGAQILAERAARHKALLAEIRSINMAIASSFGITNTFIAMKKQHVLELVLSYNEQKRAVQDHLEKVQQGSIPPSTRFQYNVELKSLQPPYTPIESLRALLEEKVSADVTALVLLTPLTQCIGTLAECLQLRNQFIEEFRLSPTGNVDAIAALYFGLDIGGIRADERYSNFVRAMGEQTDCCIGFSISLTRALIAIGEILISKSGSDSPEVIKPKLSKEAEKFVPDLAPYETWPKVAARQS